jgi:hypothetical protein
VSVSITFPGAPEGVDEVTLDHVAANVAENTSGATINFSVCTKGPAQDVMGTYDGDLHHVCVAVRPATDVQLAGSDYLMMTARAAKAGVLDVSSFDFAYRYGPRRLYQHGTQETGIRVTITAP